MVCPKCGSENVLVQSEQVSGKSGISGGNPLMALGRIFLIICTCGLWLLVPKHIGSSKTKYKNNTVGICQSCGNKWTISKG